MLLIGICDGDTAVRIMLGDFIRRYRDETGLTVQILAYDNGEKLLLHYPFEMDLIFLEIPFTGMKGIEIARRIREVDTHVGIVFLTSVFSHVFEAYEVRASNYFIKPLKYSRFLKEVEQARTRRGQNRFFLESNNTGVYKIYTKTIRYIETEGHNTRIHTETDSILCHKHLKEHQQLLFEPYFVRCHTGFIVNLLFFEKLERNDLILSTGEKIPVSRQRKKETVNKIKDLYSQ
ncbi:MAG: LytTR family DNA-binding domain-containing protein [Defluviitaleaceae bacterium]|nr:LytTR family DNA-binding domain-containing protein [Defluviitaleaceae bacterium]